MYYDTLNSEQQISFLIKPIIEVLQEAGGQLERSEIRDRISEKDEHIAEFEQKLYTSIKTGNQYKKFDFKFNFALKELSYVGFLVYEKYKPLVTLTAKGSALDLDNFDVKTEVREKAAIYWNEKGLCHMDDDDFRTTRVVIQCKRYNTAPVSEPDINQFLGAMNKFQADYGVFITNSRFTNAARIAAREGTPITLIDGNDLIRLIIKYELFITPITTYVLDEFYNEE